MHKDFKENNQEINCPCDIYRSVTWDMNINFAKLGEEGCETCDQFHQNKNSHEHEVNVDELEGRLAADPRNGHEHEAEKCVECERWVKHKSHEHSHKQQESFPNSY